MPIIPCKDTQSPVILNLLFPDSGQSEETLEDYLNRLKSLFTNIYKCNFAGFCYTQLTDVEQELNGIYNYDRSEKFDAERLYKINTKVAAIEKI